LKELLPVIGGLLCFAISRRASITGQLRIAVPTSFGIQIIPYPDE
jgi:hypothetical protein